MSMREIRCRSCGRAFGVAVSKDVPAGIYCSEECAQDFDLSRFEERDALVSELAADGMTYDELSRLFSISKQRAHQIVRARVAV